MARSKLVQVLRLAVPALVIMTLLVTSAAAQDDERRCALLCAPALKIEPTLTVENLGGGPRVEVDGQVEQADAEMVFELIFALDVPTQIPRVGFSLEAIFVPF